MFVVLLKAVSKLKWKLAHYGTRRFHCLNQSNTNKNYFYSLTIIGPNRSMRLCFCMHSFLWVCFPIGLKGGVDLVVQKSVFNLCCTFACEFVFLVTIKVMFILHGSFKSCCCMVNISLPCGVSQSSLDFELVYIVPFIDLIHPTLFVDPWWLLTTK